ncbi:MAG: type IV pilin biogenesis protein [Nannocystaceae bacterium]
MMLTIVALSLVTRESQARLEPYYILRGASFSTISPRVLLVLDTSGSMAWRADDSEVICAWNDCEDGEGSAKSRIATARAAIQTLIETIDDQASFALMTFDQESPPTATGHVPSECSGQRFSWVEEYTGDWSGWEFADPNGYAGTWRLCGTNRPYPYLRWDDLGEGASIGSNNQTGDIPGSPLIGTDYGDFADWDNAYRKVQWFPEFMGARVQLNANTDPDEDFVSATYGDYGNTNRDRDDDVWEHDFYYWPYVDGFPGYSMFYGWEWDYTELGVAEEDNSANSASLYAPFYLASDLQSFSQSDIGPISEEAAKATVMTYTSHMTEGGVDASGGTPWKSVIGPITGSPPQSNGVFSHSTVASYLRFAQNVSEDDLCVPHSAVLVTDGDPDPVNTEGGSGLHSRLAALRTELGAKVYVVGFVHSSNSLNSMACASAGSDSSSTPCSGTSAKEWDTCADPDNPATGCAFVTDSAGELADALIQIVEGQISLNMPSGPMAIINEFPVASDGAPLQTNLSAYTEWPGWKGHVLRSVCDVVSDDESETLEAYCVDDGRISLDGPTFGTCEASRDWDAGECLQQTNWGDRRIYMNDGEGGVFRISDDSGGATDQFVSALNDEELGVVGGPFEEAGADAIAAFILGQDWPDDWKLPGLANSAPVMVRRIPEYDADTNPSVGIRDPHCAGRRLSEADHLPVSLEAHAQAVWSEDSMLEDPESHYEYQEAVIVGDDLGVLHAFQLGSGNELWGLLPRYLLHSAVTQHAEGADGMGQPDTLEEHHYGIAATANQGWVFDADADEGEGKWRHILIVGSGIGGSELLVLDVSHMSPESDADPVEVLWTTRDSDLADTYAPLLGETWSRPALIYSVPDDLLTREPTAYLAFGSGYPDEDDTGSAGRTLLLANAVTGELVDSVSLPAPSGTTYDDTYGAVVDMTVGTHCVSRYWSEMQEAYILDPAGRLFRWDLGRETDHAADSGETWDGDAVPLATFRACQGEEEFDCTIASDNKADPFFYAPAVSSIDRIDDDGDVSGNVDASKRDQFLLAMVSGSIYDDATDGNDETNDYHSSIYLIADDHRNDAHDGLSIPQGGGTTAAGTETSFFRLPLSDIERTRTFRPVAGGDTYAETRSFSRQARPIRGPRIRITGAYDPDNPEELLEGVEIYYVEYLIYEPGTSACDDTWFNEDDGEWVFDRGSTYTIRMRLTVSDADGFDFVNGSGYALEDDEGFSESGLELGSVTQYDDGDCDDGVCGPQLGSSGHAPCKQEFEPAGSEGVSTIPLGWSELDGFSPVEVSLAGSTGG